MGSPVASSQPVSVPETRISNWRPPGQPNDCTCLLEFRERCKNSQLPTFKLGIFQHNKLYVQLLVEDLA